MTCTRNIGIPIMSERLSLIPKYMSINPIGKKRFGIILLSSHEIALQPKGTKKKIKQA